MSDERELDYGPSGYLPERASKRARKIVLRAPLGLQWVVGSLVAGAVVVIAGVLFLQRGANPPGDPWVELAPVTSVAASEHDPSLDVLVVGAGGRIRVFAGAADVAYCEASNRLEDAEGNVWALTGRGYGGVASLSEHPVLVWRDIVFVDLERTVDPGPPLAASFAPGCT